jgi:hypothetical protein
MISSSLNFSERERNAASSEGVRARRNTTTGTRQLLQDDGREDHATSQSPAAGRGTELMHGEPWPREGRVRAGATGSVNPLEDAVGDGPVVLVNK